MAKEKISDYNKKKIAKMGLKGDQFKQLAGILNVSETTTRKADKIGSLLNRIDDLEYDNRSKDMQIMLLQAPSKIIQAFKKTKHK